MHLEINLALKAGIVLGDNTLRPGGQHNNTYLAQWNLRIGAPDVNVKPLQHAFSKFMGEEIERGSLNKFPDFFRMGTFIDSTHMKLSSPSK